jgi:ABC-2 type transport system permease protein
MLHNLQIEWLKVKKYSTFWVLSGLFLVSLFGINYITYLIQSKAPKDPMSHAVVGTPFKFPEVWHTVSYMSSFLLFIPGLLMIIFISNEFSFKTHRQNIIDGMSRTEFIITKMVIAVILSVLCTVAVLITAYLFGLTTGGEVSYSGIKYITYFFVQAISYTVVAMVFGLLFRRSGIAIGIYFLYIVILENMMVGIINKFTNHFGEFLPLQCTDSLIPFPFFKSITQKLIYTPNTTALLIVAAIYLLAYFILSKRHFEMADL